MSQNEFFIFFSKALQSIIRFSLSTYFFRVQPRIDASKKSMVLIIKSQLRCQLSLTEISLIQCLEIQIVVTFPNKIFKCHNPKDLKLRTLVRLGL